MTKSETWLERYERDRLRQSDLRRRGIELLAEAFREGFNAHHMKEWITEAQELARRKA